MKGGDGSRSLEEDAQGQGEGWMDESLTGEELVLPWLCCSLSAMFPLCTAHHCGAWSSLQASQAHPCGSLWLLKGIPGVPRSVTGFVMAAGWKQGRAGPGPSHGRELLLHPGTMRLVMVNAGMVVNNLEWLNPKAAPASSAPAAGLGLQQLPGDAFASPSRACSTSPRPMPIPVSLSHCKEWLIRSLIPALAAGKY